MAVKRENWEEPLLFLRAPPLIIGKVSERLLRELKVPKALKFVTMSFPMSWLFAIIAETRNVLFLLWSLCLLQMKIKSFGTLGFTAQGCRFARLTKSGVNIVSHSILFLWY